MKENVGEKSCGKYDKNCCQYFWLTVSRSEIFFRLNSWFKWQERPGREKMMESDVWSRETDQVLEKQRE